MPINCSKIRFLLLFQKTCQEFHKLLWLFDMHGMGGIGDDVFLEATTMGLILLQYIAGLGNHWLRRVNIVARPAGDKAQLTQCSKIEHRIIGYDLIIAAMYP